jgi:hypothetical protein
LSKQTDSGQQPGMPEQAYGFLAGDFLHYRIYS